MNTENPHIYDILLIGLGPAGLSFISNLQYTKNYIVIELGKPLQQRNRHNEKDIVSGTGGAGLFSDGKFSFYPSGSQLWKNMDKSELQKAFQVFKNDFQKYFEQNEQKIPEFPSCIDQKKQEQFFKDNEYFLKDYPSFYLSLEQRIDLIEELMKKIEQKNIRFNSKVVGIKKIHNQLFEVELNCGQKLLSKKIVAAGGRFQPIDLVNFTCVEKKFKRIEFGVRVVGNSNLSVFQDKSGNLDPKYIMVNNNNDQKIEYRTFCWCREGEYSLSDFEGIKTYSGRADIEKSGQSNFGFMCRIKEKQQEQNYIQNLVNIQPFEIEYEYQSILFQEKLGNLFQNRYLGDILIQGLQKFLGQKGGIKVVGPCIEGVGEYPIVKDDNILQVQDNQNIYCIGDASGEYRGIVACMISGYALSNQMNLEENIGID